MGSMGKPEAFAGLGSGPVMAVMVICFFFLGRFSVTMVEPQSHQVPVVVPHFPETTSSSIVGDSSSSSSNNAAASPRRGGAKCTKVQSSMAARTPGLQPVAFYIPPAQSEFRRVACSVKPVTDKIGASSIASNLKHTYDALYSKYFEPDGRRFRQMKVLEIGLGCNMNYGAGASARVWRQYLPNSDIWFGEYDQACISSYTDQIKELGVKVVTGDQADNATLARWVEETGGGFDVIIDDGGHFNHQIFNSFATLFHKALKPGGVYFIEDLRFSRERPWRGDAGSPVMAEVISDWVNSITAVPRFGRIQDLQDPAVMRPSDRAYKTAQDLNSHNGDSGYLPAWKLPVGAKMVECAAEMCAIVKCTAEDPFCPDGLARAPLPTQ